AGAAGTGAEVIEGRRPGGGVDDPDKDAGIARGAAEAIAENERPLAIVQAADLRRAVGVAEVVATAAAVRTADAAGSPLAQHHARRIVLGEAAGIGDVEGVNGRPARPEPADQPRVPRAVVVEVAGPGSRIDEKVVSVLRVRVVECRESVARTGRTGCLV